MAAGAPQDQPLRPEAAPRRIGYLGPAGTFTEEALISQPDYAGAELSELGSLPEVLDAVQQGQVDLGFVPIENAIEGTVRDTSIRWSSTTTCSSSGRWCSTSTST